jgi:hypothetical protein
MQVRPWNYTVYTNDMIINPYADNHAVRLFGPQTIANLASAIHSTVLFGLATV